MKKRKKIILLASTFMCMLIILCCFVTLFSQRTNELTKNENGKTVKEKTLVNLDCRCDMDKLYKNVPELSRDSDIIIKGKVIQKKSYIEVGSSIHSKFSVQIEEVYRGKGLPQEITLESLGGEMSGTKYLQQVDEKASLIGEKEFSKKELDEKVVKMNINGISTMEIENTYIIFASYDQKRNVYNPVGLYQGIFSEERNGEFERTFGPEDLNEEKNVEYKLNKSSIRSLRKSKNK